MNNLDKFKDGLSDLINDLDLERQLKIPNYYIVNHVCDIIEKVAIKNKIQKEKDLKQFKTKVK